MQAPSRAEAIGRLNDVLHAFVSFVPLRQRSGGGGALDGWSVAIKDNIDVAGDIVSVGTPMFAKRRATRTATAAPAARWSFWSRATAGS